MIGRLAAAAASGWRGPRPVVFDRLAPSGGGIQRPRRTSRLTEARNGWQAFSAVANQSKTPNIGGMPMTVDQVLAETSHWPTDQVETLFERLLLSNYRLPDPKVDAAWAEEIKRRIDDIESGREAGIPGEEVMARARKMVGL